MPDIDGVTLLHMMRSHNPDEQTLFVALTANVLNDEAERLIELGFDYFLSKPIDEDKFRTLLGSDTLRQHAGTASSTAKESDCTVDYERSLALSAGNESLLRQIFEILQRDIRAWLRRPGNIPMRWLRCLHLSNLICRWECLFG